MRLREKGRSEWGSEDRGVGLEKCERDREREMKTKIERK